MKVLVEKICFFDTKTFGTQEFLAPRIAQDRVSALKLNSDMTDDRDGPRHMIYDISRTVGHGRTKEVGTITKVTEGWSHMLHRVGDPI